MYKLNRLNKNQYDILMILPIRYVYKNIIKHICEKLNLRVESVLEYIFRVYFDDLLIFDKKGFEV